MNRCDNCNYWTQFTGEENHRDDQEGRCQRYPPALDVGFIATMYLVREECEFNSGESFAFWTHPITPGDGGCGEFRGGGRNGDDS